jgi:hypothetical protein
MNIIKLLTSGILLLSLAACAGTPSVNITSTPLRYQIAIPAEPAGVKLGNVHFNVITKANINAFISAQVVAQGTDNPVFIIIDTKTYQTLALNLSELRRYIVQEQAIVAYYKKEAMTINGISNQPAKYTKK